MNGKITKMPGPSPLPRLARRAAIVAFVGAAAAAGETVRWGRHAAAAAAAAAPPSTKGDPLSGSGSSQQQLESLLRDEIAHMSALTPPSPWTLLGIENRNTYCIRLKRTYKASGEAGKEEEIVISYIWRHSPKAKSVYFQLVLSKGPDKAKGSIEKVEFSCSTTESPLGGPFTITESKHRAVCIAFGLRVGATEQVNFSSLPQAVQSGVYTYLQDRGIDRELCTYLGVLAARNDKREQSTWMSRLQAYVKT